MPAMSQAHRVAVLVGSLRKESINRKVAIAAAALAPATLSLEIVEIRDLPHYDEDIDRPDHAPEAYKTFREKLTGADAFLFVTPEYNRGLPGAMKNALDVGSRPYGRSAFSRKAGAVITCSPGAVGGFGANHQLRQTMVFLDVAMMAQPEAYLGNAKTFFDDQGQPSETFRPVLQKFVDAFANWVASHAAAKG